MIRPYTPDDVRRVVALDSDPVLRNLLISQGYHELSLMLQGRTGALGINWCTLGTWASKTAGHFIRDQEIPAAFRALLDRQNIFGRLAAALDPLHLLELTSRIIGDVSCYIMTGNRVVFAELGGVFADFMATLGGDQKPDPEKLRRFQDTLKDGQPEPDVAVWDDAAHKALLVTQKGGQAELRLMVAAYYQAMFETDAKRRAELILLGNAHGGIHEQTRLQTYIAGSLDAPIADTLLAHAHQQVEAVVKHETLKAAAHKLVDELLPAIARHIEGAWQELSTVSMMELTLPDGILHLGYPIPPEAGAKLLPASLETIDNPELRALLSSYGALDVKVEPTLLERVEARFPRLFALGHPLVKVLAAGAHDWVSLQERMRYILVVFRSRAEDIHLVADPFNPTQLEALRAGHMPDAPL